MSEEEILKILNKEKSYNEEDLLIFIYDIQKANKQLNRKIEKAIEYIENNTCWELRTSKVLEILKGDKE